MTQTDLKTDKPKNSITMESNLQTQELKNSATQTYADLLRETQQAEFPLLNEVTAPFVENPLHLMNSIYDEEGTIVPCPLPDTMTRCLPQMMNETLSLYDDADIRTMLLGALMATIGSAMSHVRVRHGQRLYSLGIMNLCVGPSASGKGYVGDVASLVDGINKIICEESAQAMADHRKRHKRYTRRNSQLNFAAKGDVSNLIDVNNIAEEVDEPQAPLRRMHKLPSKTTAANLYRLIYANGENIDSYYEQMVTFVALTQPDRDLRAPILRSRLNLYRMLMIIAILRRYDEQGCAEGLFSEQRFTISEDDLRWDLAYIFYTVMQTSAIYNRLRREEKEEKTVVCISPLAFVNLLPKQFTTAVALKQGEEMGMKPRTVKKHLHTLCTKGYIGRLRQGVYGKTSRKVSKLGQAA